MSRMGRLSFLRVDLWETVRRRIMLDFELGRCQLSKLYAYNGLMLSSGTRVRAWRSTGPTGSLWWITTPCSAAPGSSPWRMWAARTACAVTNVWSGWRTFSVTEFDGEGLISKEYAARLNKALGGRHTSFQIRLPFVKGMLHQVDFHDFFRSAGTTHLTDLWGVNHPVAKVDIILTKSMFKGYGWLAEKRQVLGGLLGGFPQVPPRPVCDQCEQRAAPGVHPAELPVSHHPVHDRGGVPSPGTYRTAGSTARKRTPASG